jgi:predicted permease
MKALRRLFSRLNSCATRERDEQRLREEIEEHLTLQTAENIRAGMTPDEARRQAVLRFGAVEAVKETYRDQRGLPLMETLIQDGRHALRRLRMAPAFSVATILTLALGIGATTSIFTLVNAILLKSLPVTNPGELYRLGREAHCCYLGGYSQEKEFSLVSYDLYRYLKDNTRGFSELAAFPSNQGLFGVRRSNTSDAAQSYPGEFVSGNYFRMFGVRPYAGRTFTDADDQPGAPPVAVISYRIWEQRYGADPSVIGSTFDVDQKPVTVVGVAPPGFFGDTLREAATEIFLPLNTEPVIESDSDLKKYNIHWLNLIGRIEPGVSPTAIEAQMRVELKQWLEMHWGEMSASDRAKFPEQTLFLSPGRAGITSMRQRYEDWLVILMAVTGFVLLIVCANVANLMLIRSMERQQQTSVSMALGAPAYRVISQPLLESILLALAGGGTGLAIAFASTRLILRFAFPAVQGFAAVPIAASLSVPVLLFALAISIATGLCFSIAPAWMSMRVDPIEALRSSVRSTVRTGSLSRKTFVVLQAALSLMLLSAAGLLTTALRGLEHQDFGFEQDHRVVVSFNPRLAGYQAPKLSLLYKRIHDSVAKISGISSVALCLYSPAKGGWGAGVWINGRPVSGPKDDNSSSWNRVTPDYFQVVGTPIVRGRSLTEQDTVTSQKVAVVSEAFVRKFFEHDDPIGKYFGGRQENSHEFEIVGVAKDARYFPHVLDQVNAPVYFLPEAQADYPQKNLGSLFLHDIVILERPGANVSFASIQEAIASVDPGMPITAIRTLKEQVALQFTQQRLIARLTSLFGVLSLVLAAIGLYGVTAYNVGRRTHELGVRMALGADRCQVVRLVVRSAFGLILLGLLIGLPLAFGMGRFLANQLYGTSPYNPVVILAAIGVLGFSALVASLIPALRASLISPLNALRTE